MAVIVNDMSEVNIDAALIQSTRGIVGGADGGLVELSNGCICCTLRDDLVKEVRALALQGRFDFLLIEATGISEPMPVAEAFVFRDDFGSGLGTVARLPKSAHGRTDRMKKTETKSTLLLGHHLKALRLPTILAECEKVAARCATDNIDHLAFLLQLCELELIRR